MFYFWEDTFDNSLLCNEVFCWKYRDFLEVFDECIGQVFYSSDAFESISEKFETDDRFAR